MEILSYGGFPLDGSEGITATLLARGGSGAIDVSPQVRSVAESVGRLVGRAIEPRTLLLRVQPVSGLRADPLRAVVARAFPLGEGLKPLVAQRPDTTVVQILAEVLSVDLSPDDSPFMRPVVRLLCPDPFWETVTESSDPGPTFTVGGNVAARPRIVIPGTSGTACTRRRYAVTDRTGRGVGGYPIMLSSSWSAPAQNTVVFQNGLMVPFRVASGRLWTRVDIPPNGTTYVDVYYGAGITNTVTADALDDGGLDLAQSDNTTWRWYAIRAGRNPLAASGAWRFGRTFNHPQQRDYVFGVLADGETEARIAAADRELDRGVSSEGVEPLARYLVDDADALVLVAGVEIASASVTASALAHYWIQDSVATTSDTAGVSGTTTIDRDEVYGGGAIELIYRQPGAPAWQVAQARSVESNSPLSAWSGTLSASFSSERPVSVAVRVVPSRPQRRDRGIEVLHLRRGLTLRVNRTLTTGVSVRMTVPTTVVTLDSGKVPAISVVETVPARVLDGTIFVSTTGEWIELEEVFTDQVDLALDCDERRVAVASGPFYARGIRFSDGARWLELPPGSVLVSAPWPVTWHWHDRWLV